MSDQQLLRVRASKFWGVPLDHVFVEYSEPGCHKTDCWSVCVGLHDGPGTETKEVIWTYYHASFEDGVRTLLKRKELDTPSWQEDMEVPHLNGGVSFCFDKSAPWYQEEDPQAAWDTCEDAEVLLQVMAVTAPGRLVPICWDMCKRVARPNSDEVCLLFNILQRTFKRFEEDRTEEQRAAAHKVDAMYPDNPALEDELFGFDLWSWRYARMLSSLDAVMAGMPGKAFHVAYYARKMGLVGLVDIVRNHIAIEQFTQ